MSGDSDAGRRVARAAAEAFGGTASLALHEDADQTGALGVVTAPDSPEPGMTSCATVGLMAHDMGLTAEGASLRVELLTAGRSDDDRLAEMLVSIALAQARCRVACGHGKVVPDLVPAAYSQHDLRHVLFTVPFLWDGPELVRLDDVLVAWLLVVPISDDERDYATRHGVDALEERFGEREVNVFDRTRRSSI